jgi:SH3-like domain-containing protein
MLITLIMLACSGASQAKRDDTPHPVTVEAPAVSAPSPPALRQTVEVTLTTEPALSGIAEQAGAEPPGRNSASPSLPLVTAAENNVNIRSGPGTDYAIIGTLVAGQSLEIVGRTADSSWWQVAAPDNLGWVAAQVTTASDADDSLPVVEVAAPPVAAAPPPGEAAAVTAWQEAQVTNVVDGDTIDVLIEGTGYRVRYILVDTPKPSTPASRCSLLARKPAQPTIAWWQARLCGWKRMCPKPTVTGGCCAMCTWAI